jgi:hypothetical protein
MTSLDPREQVRRAWAFQAPGRIPRFDSFWQFPAEWRERLGPAEELTDMDIWVPNEGAFCTRERVVEETATHTVRVDTWGATTREQKGAYFAETLAVAVPDGTDPESIRFDPPDLDQRFGGPRDARAERRFIFGKTGGPYLRTTYVRGEAPFLMDVAADPALARALADRMADHLAAVGVQAIRRWHLAETGMSIWDDMAGNKGPMVSPAQFEAVFLPGYRRMIRTWRAEGVTRVFLHSDGNILPLLDMLVDAGIDGLNPLERRAGMDPFLLRQRYPRLVLIGGMDNTDTLIHGPVARIEQEARDLVRLGREGGLVIGTHSVSPEIPLEHFAAYDRVCREEGAR